MYSELTALKKNPTKKNMIIRENDQNILIILKLFQMY